MSTQPSSPAGASALDDVLARWGGRTATVDLDGEVHYAVFDGPEESLASPVLLVHGLGGSIMNWVLLADLLRQERTVYAVDLAGHGLTRATGRRSTVGANAQLVRRFLDEVIGEEVLLVGNSMGGLISTLVVGREPDKVRGLVLLNPALPAPRSRPHLQARILGTLTRPQVSRMLRARTGKPVRLAEEVAAMLHLCFGDTQRLDPDALAAHVELARAQRDFSEIPRAQTESARTMFAALARHAVVAARVRDLDMPVLLVQGTLDRLVDVSSARWLARMVPQVTYEEMEGIGHVPMLEVPELTARVVAGWERAYVG